MWPLAALADDLARIGAPVAGGAALGGLFGFLLGALAQAWVGRVIPLDRWIIWATGIGGLVGLVAVLYDQ